MGLLDTLRSKVQDTLNDPQKMDAIKGKVANAVNKRMARNSQAGYYNSGMNPGMGGYGGDDFDRGEAQYQDQGDNNSGVSADAGTWDTDGSADSGGWDSGDSMDGGGGDSGGGDF